MILAGGKWQYILTIRHDDEAGLLSLQEFLNDDPRASVSHFICNQHRIHSVMCFCHRHCNHDSLTSSQTIGLNDDGGTHLIDIMVSFERITECGIRGGWNTVA